MSEEERIEQEENLLNEVSEYLGRNILEIGTSPDYLYLARTSAILQYLGLFLHRMRIAEKQGNLHLDWNKMNRLWREEDGIFVLQAKKMSKEEAEEDREYGWTDAGKY